MIQSHWTAAFLFSLVTSVVFAVTTKNDDRERVKYGLYVFGLFMGISIVLSWVMYFGHR